jgi:ubiquinone/menaquinone biosynthesis C-methylase UbiE
VSSATGLPASHADRNLRSDLQMQEYIAIAERIASDAPDSLLDWGCGHGQMTHLLRERGVATSAYDYRADLADGELHPLTRFPDVAALYGIDGVRLPYESDSFDAVLSCGVLEHVEDPDASLEELRRVLHPGGVLYVFKLPNRRSWTEWFARRLGGRVFFHGIEPYDRLYGLAEARSLLERHGFRVTEARYANVMPLLVPVSMGSLLWRALWAVNRLLSAAPGLRQLANNVELVARVMD